MYNISSYTTSASFDVARLHFAKKQYREFWAKKNVIRVEKLADSDFWEGNDVPVFFQEFSE